MRATLPAHSLGETARGRGGHRSGPAARGDTVLTPTAMYRSKTWPWKLANSDRSVGANILAVTQRMGQSDPSVTLRIYGHLFEGAQLDLSNRLDELRASKAPETPSAPAVPLVPRSDSGRDDLSAMISPWQMGRSESLAGVSRRPSTMPDIDP